MNAAIDIRRALQAISAETLLGYVRELASERFGGRLSGTSEYKAAAEWTAARLHRWGVAPGGDGGTFLQAFPNPYTRILPGGGLTLHGDSQNGTGEKRWAYETDYFPGGTTDAGRITAEVVYAGFGVSAPARGYDDYAGIDVRGKIVLLDAEVPVASEIEKGFDPAVFPPWRPYSFHSAKLDNAIAHGAAGAIYGCGAFFMPNAVYRPGFVYSTVGRTVVDDLFSGTGRDHDEEIAAIRRDLKPRSFALGRTVTLDNRSEHHPEGVGYNVLGLIPGSDPALGEEALLIGGHLDHCGRAWELLPGANDDASAVAVILGVAEAFFRSGLRPRRTIVLAFFGGEEQGFLGSEFYCAHPKIPLDRTAAMINMDLVGVGEGIFAYAGKNFPELWAFFEEANRSFVGRPLATCAVANLMRPRLDGMIFAARGVPAVSFALVGPDGNSPGSHTTHDTAEAITPGPMADLSRLIFAAAAAMSGRDRLNFRVQGERL